MLELIKSIWDCAIAFFELITLPLQIFPKSIQIIFIIAIILAICVRIHKCIRERRRAKIEKELLKNLKQKNM